MLKVLEGGAEFEGLGVLDTLSKLVKFLDNVSDIGQHPRDKYNLFQVSDISIGYE